MMYDLLILGMGEEACAVALAAARRNQRVAIVDQPTGVDQRALEGVVALAYAMDGLCVDSVCGVSVGRRPSQRMSAMAELWSELPERVSRRRADAVAELSCRGIDCLVGRARFEGPHEVIIETAGLPTVLTAERIVIATGTHSARAVHLEFDRRRVLTLEDLPDLFSIPHRLAVVVDDVSGAESVELLCRLGARVTVLGEAVGELSEQHMRRIDSGLDSAGLPRPEWRVGAGAAVMEAAGDSLDHVLLSLADGTHLEQDAVLYCGRVCGNTDTLHLPAAGLEADDRGQLWCNERCQTWLPHIFGLGDVIGYPSAAALLSRCGADLVDAVLDVDTADEHRRFEWRLPHRPLAAV